MFKEMPEILKICHIVFK